MSDERAPSVFDLDLGFLALSRRLWGSAWFQSLRPDEKLVVLDALMTARYADGGEFWFAGQRIPLAIGQFIDSEEERARRLGVSRKVVRTTDRKMVAAGLLSRTRAHPSGRCPFITTILNYDRIRLRRDDAGPRTEPRAGQSGASSGPVAGLQGAPSEPGNPGEPGEPGNPPSSLRSEGAASAGASPPLPPSPVVVSLPCVGTGPKEFAVTEAQVNAWQADFPGVDVLGEVRKARAWLEATPAKRKTHKGMPRFLVGWFGRTQDRGGGERPAAPPSQRPKPAKVIVPAAPRWAFIGGSRGFGDKPSAWGRVAAALIASGGATPQFDSTMKDVEVSEAAGAIEFRPRDRFAQESLEACYADQLRRLCREVGNCELRIIPPADAGEGGRRAAHAQ